MGLYETEQGDQIAQLHNIIFLEYFILFITLYAFLSFLYS